MREVPSVPLRGQSAARAAALHVTRAMAVAPNRFMNFRARFCRHIFLIALGVAHWVMREAITQTSSAILSNRRGRGMAENIDVAHPSDAPALDRLPMRDEDGEIRQEFVEEISRAIHAADAPLLRAIVAELHEATSAT